MKKTIFAFAVIIFIAGAMFTGCQSSATKVENAENKLIEANKNAIDAQQNLNEVRRDSMNEYLAFKKLSEDKINAQEKSIAEFKMRIANEKKENKAKYEKKLAELEQKNSDLKKKLDDYELQGKNNWEQFKTEVGRELEVIRNTFNDLTTKNIK